MSKGIAFGSLSNWESNWEVWKKSIGLLHSLIYAHANYADATNPNPNPNRKRKPDNASEDGR